MLWTNHAPSPIRNEYDQDVRQPLKWINGHQRSILARQGSPIEEVGFEMTSRYQSTSASQNTALKQQRKTAKKNRRNKKGGR